MLVLSSYTSREQWLTKSIIQFLLPKVSPVSKQRFHKMVTSGLKIKFHVSYLLKRYEYSTTEPLVRIKGDPYFLAMQILPLNQFISYKGEVLEVNNQVDV